MVDQNVDVVNQKRGRTIFLLMGLFFITPVIVVMLMIKYDWKPAGESLGELVTPPRLITLTTNEATKQYDHFWGDKWNMVYVAKQCDDVCMTKLQDMRQIHVSMYKNIMRVQRVFVTEQSNVEQIRSKFPKLIVINQDAALVAELSEQFNLGAEDALETSRIYFVDPLGHIMMSYDEEMEAKFIRKDLVKLVKYSWAG